MSAPFNTVYADGGPPVTGDGLNTFIQVCATLATARAFVGIAGMSMFLQGFAASGDGGQGEFYWNVGATSPVDDGGVTTIVPTGAASGCWSRLGAVFTRPNFLVSLINAPQVLSSGVEAAVLFDTVVIDPTSAWSGHQWTPKSAGNYYVFATLTCFGNFAVGTQIVAVILKDGAFNVAQSAYLVPTASAVSDVVVVQGIVGMNGTTDNVSVAVNVTVSSGNPQVLNSSAQITTFGGFLL